MTEPLRIEEVDMSDPVPDEARAREDLCRFLSACYYEPTPLFAEEGLFETMRAAAAQLDASLAARAQRLGEAYAAQALETLLVDYTRLFLGPMQPLARPYGSFWLDGKTTETRDATAVLELYREGGFRIDAEFSDLPDHVAVELEFLYLLEFSRNEARRSGNRAAHTALGHLQQRFLAEHLGAWVGPFTAALAAGAQTPFYRELAALTGHFVHLASTRSKGD